ncbi:MAG: hypothetical protein KBD21_00435 [Candidatus Pacebacteria bacterium]|nr:hypothetical protein [Candidatus Paceibacterota bacterium]
MAKQEVREIAQRLRREGHSIGEIVTILQQPKSTVSYWCKNIVLTEQQIRLIQEKHTVRSVATLLRVAEKQRAERLSREQKAAESGRKDVGQLTGRDLYMLGLGLYWGEGYKYAHCELGFTNSNPIMIRTYMAWLERVYGIERGRMTCRISVNEVHRERIHEVERFWQEVTGLAVQQFTKTSFIKAVTKKKYTNGEMHHGTLRIKVQRGTSLRNRIMGTLDCVGQSITGMQDV